MLGRLLLLVVELVHLSPLDVLYLLLEVDDLPLVHVLHLDSLCADLIDGLLRLEELLLVLEDLLVLTLQLLILLLNVVQVVAKLLFQPVYLVLQLTNLAVLVLQPGLGLEEFVLSLLDLLLLCERLFLQFQLRVPQLVLERIDLLLFRTDLDIELANLLPKLFYSPFSTFTFQLSVPEPCLELLLCVLRVFKLPCELVDRFSLLTKPLLVGSLCG